MGITRILSTVASLIVQRERVSFYWPHLTWLLLLFFLLIQYWFNLYSWRDVHYNFYSFISSLIFPLGAFLSCSIMAISLPEKGKVDLREFYFLHSQWFFSIACFSILYLIFHDCIIMNCSIFTYSNYIRIFASIILFILALSKHKTLHSINSVILFVLFLIFVVINQYIPR